MKSHGHSSDHVVSIRLYVVVFTALLVLTAITVWTARHDFGALNTPVAMGIAVVKALLVILFFMHVKYGSRMTKLIVGVAFFFLGIMLTLTLSDYLSRGWFTAPDGSTVAGAIISLSGPPQPIPPVEPVPPAEPGQNTSPK